MSRMMYILLIGILPLSLWAQQQEEVSVPQAPLKGIILPGIIVGADTFAYVSLPDCKIEAEMPAKTRKQYVEWTRLRHNVKKVYPYAIIASARLKEYEKELQQIPSETARKTFMKEVEKKLEKEFGDQLKNLTITQGRILIKLIDRETGQTSYELVKQLRGSFSAFMWQSLASLFGSTLKSEYDPKGEDRMIEMAIRQIEAGQF